MSLITDKGSHSVDWSLIDLASDFGEVIMALLGIYHIKVYTYIDTSNNSICTTWEGTQSFDFTFFYFVAYPYLYYS